MITIPSYNTAVFDHKAFSFIAGQIAAAEDQNTIQQSIYEVMADLQSNIVSESSLIRGELNASSTTLANEIVTNQTDISTLFNVKANWANTLVGYNITDAININKLGNADGVCPLDVNSKVPSSYLPSYVDDIVEFAELPSFPAIGETGKIYVAIDSGKIYRWSGSTYIFLEAHAGTADAARMLNTPRNITATGDISWSTQFDGSTNSTGVATLSNTGVSAGIYTKVNVDSKGRVIGATTLSSSDVPTLNQDTTGRAENATNADKANKLATPRKINDVYFDGTTDISFPVGEKIDSSERVNSFVAVSNSAYMINADALTVTLPNNPTFGDRITLYDITKTLTSLTINGGSRTIEGSMSKLVEYSGFKLELVFTSTRGWVVFNCSVN